MKKHLLLSVLALTLLASGAFAANSDTPPPPPPHEAGQPLEEANKAWTLQEARQKAHEHADKLDKMTEEQWAEHQKKRKEFMEKWHNMTPEQKEEMRKKREEHRKEKEASDSKAPAPTAPASK